MNPDNSGAQAAIPDIQEDKYQISIRRYRYALNLSRKSGLSLEAAKAKASEYPDASLLNNLELTSLRKEVVDSPEINMLRLLTESELKARRVKYLSKLLKSGKFPISECKEMAIFKPEEFFLTAKEKKELKARNKQTIPMTDSIRESIQKILEEHAKLVNPS